MDRAYAQFQIKAVDEEKRVITGWATTPAVDRVGDIVDPLGVKFKNPMPFLWQHRSAEPIGTVTFGKPTKDGVPFEATIPTIADLGTLRDRIEEAWQSIKTGLVRAVSIGFRALEYAFMDDGGIRYLSIEVYELSAVTIPANAECTIDAIKSFDKGAPAATGQIERPKKSALPAPGNSKKPVSLRPEEGTKMKTIAEQITALEETRKTKASRLEAIQSGASDAGRTKDASEREEFDTLRNELKTIDEELADLKDLEGVQARGSRQVNRIETPHDGSANRGGAGERAGTTLAQVAIVGKDLPGVRFARFAKVRAVSHLDHLNPLDVAVRMYGSGSEIAEVIKAAVVAGSNASGNWASALTGSETNLFADFAGFLRPATILGKFGVGNVPSLRVVPFREPLISQTGGGAGYWVGEGKPKPLTAFNFARTTLEPLKVANIAVLTEENIRSSAPSSELIVRDALRDALAERMDTDFIDPAKSVSAGVSPASITNGATVIASTGTDADHVRLDVRAVFQVFINAHNPPSSGVWIMSSTNALALSLMVNSLGQPEFPGLTMTGGTFFGLPVIVSDYAGSIVALVNASDVYEADDGDVNVDMSREASLEMKDGTLTQDGTAGTGVAMVSLWQSNLVGLRAEKTINWKRRRTSGVAYLSGVVWGGAVPAS